MAKQSAVLSNPLIFLMTGPKSVGCHMSICVSHTSVRVSFRRFRAAAFTVKKPEGTVSEGSKLYTENRFASHYRRLFRVQPCIANATAQHHEHRVGHRCGRPLDRSSIEFLETTFLFFDTTASVSLRSWRHAFLAALHLPSSPSLHIGLLPPPRCLPRPLPCCQETHNPFFPLPWQSVALPRAALPRAH